MENSWKFRVPSKCRLLIVCLLVLTVASAKKCALDSDCGIGFKCQKIQECDDFGCRPPAYECFPNDELAFSSGIDDSDNYEAPNFADQSTEETTSHIQQAASASTADGAKRPSRLIIRTQNEEKSILRFDAEGKDVAYEIFMDPKDQKLTIGAALSSAIKVSKNETEIDNVWKFTGGHLKYDGVPQWKLVHDEIFKAQTYAEGWSLPEATTKWGAVHMLGGYWKTSSEHLSKVFDGLPPHKRIRIQANFHFLDSWGGDTAFLRVSEAENLKDLSYVWTDSYDYVSSRNAINVCGRDIGDGKFNVFIDVELAHTYNSINMMFGTSLEQDACSASYGISLIRIFVI